jgi:hypothetical protein
MHAALMIRAATAEMAVLERFERLRVMIVSFE